MVNSESLILTSGVILTILISATVISYTSKFFASDNVKKSTNFIYDSEQGLNISNVCVFSKNAYKTLYENSPCFNKTLVHWYNPWLRHDVWTDFWNKIKARNRLKMLKQKVTTNQTEIPIQNDTFLPTEAPSKKEKEEVQKLEEKPIEFVYSILVGMLIVSGIFACWEVCKDKLKRNEGAEAKAQDRQCSLAEFTINRHLRRESQQQTFSHLPKQGSPELTAKVTQNLIHQSSLDRAFPKMISEVTSLESRRNSVPLYLNSDIPAGHSVAAPSSRTFKLTKRQSLDVPGEEICSDPRKKPRHFIRRH